MLILWIAMFAAIGLGGIFVFATGASSRAKGIVVGLIVVSIVLQRVVSSPWGGPTGTFLQAVVCFCILIYLKVKW